MRSLRLLTIYIWRELLQTMAWRAFLLTLVVNQAVTPLIGLAVWSVALPGSKAVSTYYVALLVVQLMTVSYEHHTFANGIYGGDLNHDLLRPHPIVIIPLGINLALRIWHLLIGLPLIVSAAFIVGVTFEGRAVLLALPALALAAALRFLFTYTLALSAFWTERGHGIVGFGETLLFLLGGSAAPILLLPPPFRLWGNMLPFRFMLGFPAEIATGSLSDWQVLQGYIGQLVWLIGLLWLATMVWQSGIRRYTAVGG